MYKVIDPLTTDSWAKSPEVIFFGENSYMLAGNQQNSLTYLFSGGSITKTFSENVEAYDKLSFHISSRNFGKKAYSKVSDFQYAITINTTKFYLRAFPDWQAVSIDISSFTSITSIKIEALSTAEDYITISYMVVSKDVFPFDILQGIKEQALFILAPLPVHQIALFSSPQGRNYIEFVTRVPFLDRYNTIKITDGVHTEYHHIKDVSGNRFYLGNLYDGNTLLHAYTNGVASLHYPIEFGRSQKEMVFPSITLWGFASEAQKLSSDLDNEIENITDSGFTERQVSDFQNLEVLIDCEADEYEILGELSFIVRKLIEEKQIWVNGKKANLIQTAMAEEIQAIEPFDIIPKIQYPVSVSVREDLHESKSLVRFTELNLEVDTL